MLAITQVCVLHELIGGYRYCAYSVCIIGEGNMRAEGAIAPLTQLLGLFCC